MRLGRGFPFVGFVLLGWAMLVIVVAALTTWWVLFALFALLPLAMMSSMVMMGTMDRSAGEGPRAGPRAWCARWSATWLGSTDGGQRPRETPLGREETPLAILDRRFAEGAISPEDYRARREVLVNGTAEPTGAHKDEPLVAARAGEESQR